MASVKVTCSNCGKIYLKELRRVNEAKKFHWKQYCSLKCQKSAKNKQITLFCSNPLCRKSIKRDVKEIPASGMCYCSRSCSAIVNNTKFPKRKPFIRKCKSCGKGFYSLTRRKYCSVKCYPHRQIFPKEKIIEEIQQFYNQQGRIPFKKEYFHWKAARTRFGTWNKAIAASGFDPNPVLFTKKHTAKDGHICNSLSEMIIDNWLFTRKISHERNAPYLNTKFTTDFKVKDIYIEFFGLHKELKRYDQLMKKKLKIIKKNNLKLIAIYPKDLFLISKLDFVLKELLN